MKSIILWCVVLCGLCNADIELWKRFKTEHGKQYLTVAEEVKRYRIFQENLKRIEEHNIKYREGKTTYYEGINKFSDLTKEEFRQKYLTEIKIPTERRESKRVYDITDVPDSIDWRDKNVVTTVKNQETCGACYAFASVAAVESAYAIAGKGLLNLSVQQVIDCSIGDTYLNHGCNGGIIEGSIHYVMDHGIESWESYPYDNALGACRANSSLNAASATAYENVPANETLLKNAVGGIAPVAACIDAMDFDQYSGGIIDTPCYSNITNHVILIVGYGSDNGVDYWLCKNEWGEDWGVNGYVKVRRNNNNAGCISTYTAYAII